MIETYEFGHIRVDGSNYSGDIKIISGKVVSDWWRKESHVLDIEDILDVLSSGVQTLVVGTGQPGHMKVSDALRSHLSERDIILVEKPTARAIKTFNEMFSSGRKVAGAFHLTC